MFAGRNTITLVLRMVQYPVDFKIAHIAVILGFKRLINEPSLQCRAHHTPPISKLLSWICSFFSLVMNVFPSLLGIFLLTTVAVNMKNEGLPNKGYLAQGNPSCSTALAAMIPLTAPSEPGSFRWGHSLWLKMLKIWRGLCINFKSQYIYSFLRYSFTRTLKGFWCLARYAIHVCTARIWRHNSKRWSDESLDHCPAD